ncbi:DNA methyltransferase [Helicobacter sp. MIT 14-3879]|uniref:DNA methyltransferase n=1 Tax=Helicobacter sp. MIT 14-3879 TaxID=2040649 RepID=UPI000E1E776B|nr:DNA methyltransferase [Helicobacter sp. MIT 14-3879]RDU62678.1 hypothetical protein CQA44_06740 [Helicobacter sp. MIT 14-3879]
MQDIKKILANLKPTKESFKTLLDTLFGFEKLTTADTSDIINLTNEHKNEDLLSLFDFQKTLVYFTNADWESELQQAKNTEHKNLAFSLIPTQTHHKSELIRAIRAINKKIKSYNILFFISKDSLSIAFATRRYDKNSKVEKDVIDKITLIKDILLSTPSKAHLKNLESIPKITHKEIDKYYSEILDKLSISALTDAFYKEIREHFIKFKDSIKLPNDRDENTKRAFVLRLISRILFVKFLEKKGLVSPKIWNISLSSSYYHQVLEPLFFITLNTPKDNRDYGLLDSYIKELLNSIPYLNGGLFAPQEKDYFDINNRNITTLEIPNERFDELFKTLDNYHFTIDEATLHSEEVGLDPEMLGKVFENLLSVLFTDNRLEDTQSLRKKTGSYYTPREIVSYMCASSLCESLKNHTNINEESLKKLIFDKDAIDLSEIECYEVLNTLASLKILDPACGSGAFPIGILQEIIEIENTLFEAMQNKGYSKHFEKSNLLQEQHLKQSNLYERKLRILQNNIYGVDIQPMATEIARLRCFLSLICDAPSENIQPLPNLEFKFISANSLIPLHHDNLQYDGYIQDMEELRKIREQTFNTQDKEQVKAAYLTLRDKIARNISTAIIKVGALKSQESSKDNKNNNKLDINENPIFDWNPFDPNSVAGFFDSEWMFGIKANGGGIS